MTTEIRVPVLPESVADAVIANWYKQPGEAVKRDEVLVDLETDKVILEVPSLVDGVVTELKFSQGDTVTADQVIAIIDATSTQAVETSSVDASKPEQIDELSREPSITPSARKLMLENDLTKEDVVGTGKAGRVLKEDVLDALKRRAESPLETEASVSPNVVRSEEPTEYRIDREMPTDRDAYGRVEKRMPMSRLRARVAERLLEAQHNAAILTTFNEVDMKPIMDLRSRYKDRFLERFGVKLGFMSFFVKAAVEALKQFPEVNASIDGGDIVYHGYFDIGVAVSGANGLVVPILRDADELSVADIEKRILELATRARENTITMDDITGGTFTISNGGVFGSMLSTPIINPPQSAILGMHTIKERPVVIDGQVVVRPVMYLALSYDHRIIDGREAVQFLVAIKDVIEDPSRLILGV